MVYETNLSILSKNHHPVAEKVAQVPSSQLSFHFDENGNGILAVDDAHKNSGLYISGHIPSSDIDDLVDQINSTPGALSCMLGAGLCFYPDAFEKINANRLLIICEAKPEILKAAMEHSDLTKVFSNPNIRFLLGSTMDVSDILSDETAKLLSARGYQTYGFDCLTTIEPGWYENIARNIEQFFIKRNQSAKVIEHAGRNIFENRFKNLYSMVTSLPVDVLKDRYNGRLIIIVASGPSLENNIHELKKAPGAVIIAVDSAVAPLMNHQICPDYIVTADFRELTFEKLAPFSEIIKESRLIYFAEGTPKIPACLSFKETYWLFLESPVNMIFKKLLNTDFSPVPDAQSVVHGAMHIAHLMGGDPIVLTGLDLAFSDNKDHAEGTILHWGNHQEETSNSLFVEGMDGKPVLTEPGFVAQKEICEQLIKKYDGCRWIDASEGGAKIMGTKIESLNRIVTDFCSEQKTDTQNETTSYEEIALDRFKKVLSVLNDFLKQFNQFKRTLENYFSDCDTVQKTIKGKYWKKLSDIPNSVKEKITKMDRLNIRFNDNSVIKALKELVGTSYDSYLDLTLEDPDDDKRSELMNRISLDVRQQAHVQKIRYETICEAERILGDQIDFFSELIQLEKRRAEDPDQPDNAITTGILYYNHGLLSQADAVFKSLAENPEAMFYRGCIHLLKGDMEAGKKLFDKISLNGTEYKERIDVFIKDMVEVLLDENEQGIIRKMNFERILKLDPDNKKAFGIMQKEALSDARQMLKTNQACDARKRLTAVWNKHVVPDVDYAALLAILLAGSDQYDFLLEVLDFTSNNHGWEKTNINCYNSWLSMMESHKIDWTDDLMPGRLCKLAGKESVNTVYIQRIFGAVMRYNVWRLSIFDKNEHFLLTVENELGKWRPIKQFFPDWYVFKSFHSFNSENTKQALDEIDLSILLEKETMPGYRGKGDTYYTKSLFLALSGHPDKAFDNLEIALSKDFKVDWWLTWLLELMKRGRRNDVLNAIKDMGIREVDRKPKSYFDCLVTLNEQGEFICLIDEISYACNVPHMGERLLLAKIFFNGELKADLIDLTRHIVTISDVRLDREKTPMLIEFINEVFKVDAQLIIKGERGPDDSSFEAWECLCDFLRDWPLVKSEWLFMKGKRPEAVEYLETVYPQYKEDISYLKLYAYQLFAQERMNEALGILEQLLSISPESVSLLKEVGDNYFAEKKYQAALTIYEECLELMPDQHGVLFNIGEIYFLTGNMDAASLAFTTLVQLVPGHEKARERLATIKKPYK